MFEYELISRARSVRRHVVLPEGTEERILRATEILLRRGVCDVTLLGPVDDVRRRIRELALTLDGAAVIDPATSPWRDEFATAYATMRAAKGVTVDAARDRLADPNYFGTMMVHRGYADAMVSGAAHPTADTIRPAFEIIKTVPGLSAASSVFFMCLADQVLVYGDCAINPDPDPRQLADIAISSAATAAAFGIEPRVAMLSYSTGTSGHGIDVEKVAAATDLVRQRRPGPARRRAHPVRRGGRPHRRRCEGAGQPARRPRNRADLSRPQHRQQHLQGGPALRRRGRHRPRPAGPP